MFRKTETDKMLKQEVKQLRGVYKKTYRDMNIYLGSFSLNYYAKQEVLLELAGICLENQKRNSPIEEVFNHNSKAFCNSLIENCKRKTVMEKLLEYAVVLVFLSLLGFLFICIAIEISEAYPDFSMMEPLYIKQGSLYCSAYNLLPLLGIPLLFFFMNQIQYRFVYASKGLLIFLLFIGYFIINMILQYVFKNILEESILELPIFLTIFCLSIATVILCYAYFACQLKSNHGIK